MAILETDQIRIEANQTANGMRLILSAAAGDESGWRPILECGAPPLPFPEGGQPTLRHQCRSGQPNPGGGYCQHR